MVKIYIKYTINLQDQKKKSDDLQTMLDDKSIKAIFCVRGGYGTVRIIDKIDFSFFK